MQVFFVVLSLTGVAVDEQPTFWNVHDKHYESTSECMLHAALFNAQSDAIENELFAVCYPVLDGVTVEH